MKSNSPLKLCVLKIKTLTTVKRKVLDPGKDAQPLWQAQIPAGECRASGILPTLKHGESFHAVLVFPGGNLGWLSWGLLVPVMHFLGHFRCPKV